MRIVHVTKKYPEASGGDGIVVSRLKAEQEAAGHVVTVITPSCPDITPESRVVQVGLSLSSAELDSVGPRRLVSLGQLAAASPRLFRQFGPDVIHTHAIDLLGAVAPTARLLAIPMVHTCHDLSPGNPHVAGWKWRMERWVLHAARPAMIVALTHQARRQLETIGLSNVAVIPNGSA
jgi:glycosyltransferase involved in cell wall biosynthesis